MWTRRLSAGIMLQLQLPLQYLLQHCHQEMPLPQAMTASRKQRPLRLQTILNAHLLYSNFFKKKRCLVHFND